MESRPGEARSPHARSARFDCLKRRARCPFCASSRFIFRARSRKLWPSLLERWEKSPVTAGIAAAKFLHRIRLDEAETVDESVG